MAFKEGYDRIDARLFPAFMAAAQTENFTEAAKIAAMTQSGISQHISKLEEQVGLPLFQRGGGHIKLTQTGRLLVRFIEDYMADVDRLFSQAGRDQTELSGTVRYAMPESCLFLSYFDSLLQTRAQDFPGIKLDVRIAGNDRIYDWLRDSQIDFAFVTEQFDLTSFKFLPFCDEEYALVGRDETLLKELKFGDVRSLPFVKWAGMRDCYEIWRDRAFPGKQLPAFASLMQAGNVDSLLGVMTMLKNAVGVTILPLHCCQDLVDRNEFYIEIGRAHV